MNNIYLIEGKIQNYQWGGFEFISDLLKLPPTDKPIAEYWLGAHPNHPSTLQTESGEQALDTFIEQHTKAVLGQQTAQDFKRLPFLFKVLDVHEMLSIQVHPTKKNAELGFQQEQALEIPISASHRNYKDDNHKPEIMVALGEFWLLHGFLSKAKLLDQLKTIPEFNYLIPIFKEQGYFGLYKTVMEYSQDEVDRVLKPLVDRIVPEFKSHNISKSNPDYWAAKACISNPNAPGIDRGLFSIYFFNLVCVNEGDAVFQDAGIPHAYLEGQNMELMANSDNVLRGGLTPKHVDVPELLKHVKFEETIPKIISGNHINNAFEKVYQTPVKDFELSQLQLAKGGVYQIQADAVQIYIALSGAVEFNTAEGQIDLKKGQAALVLAGSHFKLISKASAVLYKASVPIN